MTYLIGVAVKTKIQANKEQDPILKQEICIKQHLQLFWSWVGRGVGQVTLCKQHAHESVIPTTLSCRFSGVSLKCSAQTRFAQIF